MLIAILPLIIIKASQTLSIFYWYLLTAIDTKEIVKLTLTKALIKVISPLATVLSNVYDWIT